MATFYKIPPIKRDILLQETLCKHYYVCMDVIRNDSGDKLKQLGTHLPKEIKVTIE
jgi:hypothetical protein